MKTELTLDHNKTKLQQDMTEAFKPGLALRFSPFSQFLKQGKMNWYLSILEVHVEQFLPVLYFLIR